jgi:4-hydroxybenzoate polyprenyltransferase
LKKETTHPRFKLKKRKNLFPLLLAGLCLMGGGHLLADEQNWVQFSILALVIACGVVIIYGFNDLKDLPFKHENNRKYLTKSPSYMFTLWLFVVVCIPFGLVVLSYFQISIIVMIGLLGTLYSMNVEIGSILFHMKKVPFLKNLIIGICWGALMLLGFGEMDSFEVKILFVFISLQISLGSAIRDIADLEEDRALNVRTVPVILGIQKQLWLSHIFNATTLAGLIFVPVGSLVYLVLISFVGFRFIHLLLLKRGFGNTLLTQQVNIGFCYLLFVMLLIGQLL